MQPLELFGAAIFTTEHANSFITALTTTLTENIPAVIAIVAVVFSINFARRMINRALKGKI